MSQEDKTGENKTGEDAPEKQIETTQSDEEQKPFVPYKIALAAGGTGGHLFPALALGEELTKRTHKVMLITDERALRFKQHIIVREHYIVNSATVYASLSSKIKGVLQLTKGLIQSLRLMIKQCPDAIIGFGGYPTFPPLVAAYMLGIPVILHEQNSVFGKANRMAARFAKSIATSFPDMEKRLPKYGDKMQLVGNPMRLAVRQAAEQKLPEDSYNAFRILVFGGSQRARILSDVMPRACRLLPIAMQKRLHIVQQARDEDISSVKKLYEDGGIYAEVKPFFDDLPHQMALAKLVVARSGAATVAELATIGRGSLLVPLPQARDQDQAANAAFMAKNNACYDLPQGLFTPKKVSEVLTDLISDPQRSTDMGVAAKQFSHGHAHTRCADLIEQVLAK